jgi:hypothetical protein
MKIHVATYTDTSGYGYQKVFKLKKQATDWLLKQFERDYKKMDQIPIKEAFNDWRKYGAFTAKIKSFSVK